MNVTTNLTTPTLTNLASWVVLAQNEGPGLLETLGPPLMIIGVLFYFLIYRPQRRERDQRSLMLENLKKNDRIVTAGGIHGTVVNVQKDSDEVAIKVDESTNTKLRVTRSSIAHVLTDEPASDKKGSNQ